MNAPDRGREARIRLLYMIIFFAIVMAAGPEYFAALELTTLLELLGATLFLAAYAAAARLVLRKVWSLALAAFVPAPQRALLFARIPAHEKAAALAYSFVYAINLIALTAVFGVYLRKLPGLLM
jgi:hypothetical protein